MRDPNRIPKILIRLGKLWENNPDLRLGQLIGNYIVNEEHLYYIDDELLIDTLEKAYEMSKK